MTTDIPAAPSTKKMKWYWHILAFITCLIPLCGINGLLLQDIPFLLFCCIFVGLILFPIEWAARSIRPRWMTALISIVWLLGILALVHFLVVFVIPPFSISPQTTYLTEPRSQEFHGIDYAAYIERQLEPGIPPDENGFRLLTETFGKPLFDNIQDKHWRRLCAYLDLPTGIEPILSHTTFREYIRTLPPDEEEIIAASTGRSFSEEAIPIVKRWLDDNNAAMDLFGIVADEPAFYIPPMFSHVLINTHLFYDDTCRKMARDLAIRVRYRLTVGEIDAAWDDVRTIYRLAEHQRRAVWNVMSSLVNNDILGTANHAAESVLLHSDWDSDEILLKAEEIVPFLRPFGNDEIRKCLLGERLLSLDAIRHMAGGNFYHHFANDEEQPPVRDFWDRAKGRFLRTGLIMTKINQRFDELEQQLFEGRLEEPDDEMLPGIMMLLDLAFWHGKSGAISILIGEMLSSLLFTAIEAGWMSVQCRQADADLLRLVFALTAYHRDNGNYPEGLDALQERYIAELPFDPFSGGWFRYILEPEGYLLYSVGPNGEDDGGRNHGDFPRGDDIRRRSADA
ncbi:MAG: type II secretion system protein GspG [Planctomycetaceae bacterium]|nr:type II secretion system protein GspG [Planctomycetaceae bacterium]